MQVRVALGQGLRMGEGTPDGARPAEKAVAHGMHMLAHDSQAGQLPQHIGHLLHDAGAAVLHGQHRRIDSAHRERLEGQPKRRIADRVRSREDRGNSLVRIRARFALVGNLHPKNSSQNSAKDEMPQGIRHVIVVMELVGHRRVPIGLVSISIGLSAVRPIWL